MAYELSLVTGACGFTGTHLVKLLHEKGFRVRATDLASSYEKPQWKSIAQKLGIDFNRHGIEFVPADLTDKSTLGPALKGVDRLFHTASLYDYSASMDALEKVNIQGTRNLLETAIEQKVQRIMHWSTCGVYGKPVMPLCMHPPFLRTWHFVHGVFIRPWLKDKRYKRPGSHPTNVPFTEDKSNPLNTQGDQPQGTSLTNDYSVTKWKQEQLVQSFMREFGLKVTIIRPAPLYGPGSDYGVGGILIAMSEGIIPAIPSDLKNYVMSSCHVEDICRAALFVSEREDTVGEAYNVVDDSTISQGEFIQLAALLCGRKLRILHGVTMPMVRPLMVWSARKARDTARKHPNYQRLRMWEESSARYVSSSYWISNRKLKSLGYQLAYPDFKVGLRETAEWMVEMGWIQ